MSCTKSASSRSQFSRLKVTELKLGHSAHLYTMGNYHVCLLKASLYRSQVMSQTKCAAHQPAHQKDTPGQQQCPFSLMAKNWKQF